MRIVRFRLSLSQPAWRARGGRAVGFLSGLLALATLEQAAGAGGGGQLRVAEPDPARAEPAEGDRGDDGSARGSRRAVTLDDGSDRGDDGPSTLAPPNRHRVRKGETLWDICARYFHDPWRWPKVWALNPDIENPHWIFPGQVVRLDRDDTRASVATSSGAADPREVEPGLAVENALPPFSPGLKEIGFVDEGGLKVAGTISGSPEEKLMLASGDAAYVTQGGKAPLASGREYPVYEVDREHPVRDPDNRDTLGYLVYVRGFARIDDVRPKESRARATLVATTDPIERGFRVGELFHERVMVSAKPAAKAVRGRLAAALSPNLLIGRESFVVLNKGRADGVEPGNAFKVVRRGDGYHDVMEDWESDDPAYPPIDVGEILAVDVRDHTSVGWVVRAAVELRVGDAVASTRGE